MSNLDDIFDLQNDTKQEEQLEKKPRKKAEMSDDKKAAMLERLKAGREKRAENLKAKAQPKEENMVKQTEVKKEVISQKKDIVLKKTNEDERLSFIKMMAGKEKNGEKYERPKKKIVSTPKEEIKEERKKEEPKEKKTEPIIPAPVVSITPAREPVVIRTFKKPIWG